MFLDFYRLLEYINLSNKRIVNYSKQIFIKKKREREEILNYS